MKRALIIIGIVVAVGLAAATIFTDLDDGVFSLGSPAPASPSARSENEQRVLDVLKDMRARLT